MTARSADPCNMYESYEAGGECALSLDFVVMRVRMGFAMFVNLLQM